MSNQSIKYQIAWRVIRNYHLGGVAAIAFFLVFIALSMLHINHKVDQLEPRMDETLSAARALEMQLASVGQSTDSLEGMTMTNANIYAQRQHAESEAQRLVDSLRAANHTVEYSLLDVGGKSAVVIAASDSKGSKSSGGDWPPYAKWLLLVLCVISIGLLWFTNRGGRAGKGGSTSQVVDKASHVTAINPRNAIYLFCLSTMAIVLYIAFTVLI